MITMPQKINAINSASSMRTAQARQHTAPLQEQQGPAQEKFDQVTLSVRESGDPYKMKLQSKLSQEVRTATTTGTLASLRDQVQNGEYKIDARSIAKRLLLLGEV